jgi:rubrerythrin
MTIDDELILELIKPDAKGKITEGGLIVAITGTKEVRYKLEESTHYVKNYGSEDNPKTVIVKMTPDITIWKKPEKGWKAILKEVMKEMVVGPEVGIAIEVENDVQWDFQGSLKQIKKYKGKFEDTRIIISADYGRFAPLFRNEGFRIYLWKASRRWQCLRCGTETIKEGPVTPICPKCKNHSQNEFRLVGLANADIKEYV